MIYTSNRLTLGRPRDLAGLRLGGGGGVTWTPALATTSGGKSPHTWLKADAGVLDAAAGSPSTNGGVVGQWRDQSGNGNHVAQATGANKPLWIANVINGKPVLRQTTTQWLQGAFASGALSQPFTVFAVGRQDGSVVGDDASHFLVDSDDTTNRMAFFDDQQPAPDSWTLNAGVNLRAGTSDGNWHIFNALYKGASSQLWIDNVSAVSGDAGTNTPDGLTVGARFNGISNWIGDYAEILIYGSELSSADRVQVYEYLEAKY